MSSARLKKRTPNAKALGQYRLTHHQLRVHKLGMDASAKCDAYYTGHDTDYILGVLYQISEEEKPNLDRAEGLGRGYKLKTVEISNQQGQTEEALTYVATHIDPDVLPFGWYMKHVSFGASEAKLPAAYIERINAIPSLEDDNRDRKKRELSLYQKE